MIDTKLATQYVRNTYNQIAYLYFNGNEEEKWTAVSMAQGATAMIIGVCGHFMDYDEEETSQLFRYAEAIEEIAEKAKNPLRRRLVKGARK